jgi:hypothetical protein
VGTSVSRSGLTWRKQLKIAVSRVCTTLSVLERPLYYVIYGRLLHQIGLIV